MCRFRSRFHRSRRHRLCRHLHCRPFRYRRIRLPPEPAFAASSDSVPPVPLPPVTLPPVALPPCAAPPVPPLPPFPSAPLPPFPARTWLSPAPVQSSELLCVCVMDVLTTEPPLPPSPPFPAPPWPPWPPVTFPARTKPPVASPPFPAPPVHCAPPLPLPPVPVPPRPLPPVLPLLTVELVALPACPLLPETDWPTAELPVALPPALPPVPVPPCGRSTQAAVSSPSYCHQWGVAALDHASGGIPAGRCKTACSGTTGRGCAISSGGAGNSDEIRRDGGRRRKQVSVYTGRSGLILTLASGFGGGVATSDVATVRGTAGRSTSRAGAAIGIASLRGCAEAIPTGMPTAGRYRCRIIANDCGCVDRCSRSIADLLGMHTAGARRPVASTKERTEAIQDRCDGSGHAFQRRTHPYGELDPSKVQAHFPVVGDRVPVYRSSYPNASGPGHASGTVVRRYERPKSTVRVMAPRVSSPGWRSLPGWLPLVCFRLEHRRPERWRCWQSEERELP